MRGRTASRFALPVATLVLAAVGPSVAQRIPVEKPAQPNAPRAVERGALWLDTHRDLRQQLADMAQAYWVAAREVASSVGDDRSELRQALEDYAEIRDVPIAQLERWARHADSLVGREAVSALAATTDPPVELLAEILAADDADEYAVLSAALGLALAGDTLALPILRRVFPSDAYPFGYAVSNSEVELGIAARGLAILGDRDYLDVLRTYAHEGEGLDWRGVIQAVRLLEASVTEEKTSPHD